MKVLVACEESQEICMAFRKKGHDAYSCDLQDCSGGYPQWHIKDDALKIINPQTARIPGDCYKKIEFKTCDGSLHCFYDNWDLIIAHPPCTFLSKAGARWLYKNINNEKYISVKRLEELKKGVEFFNSMLNADAKAVCIENPTPLKICNLPDPTQIIQPYQFGHPYSKRTLLWLRNLPKLRPTSVLHVYTPYLPSNTSNFSKGKGGSRGVARDPKTASKTFSGIAAAMASQWGGVVNE